MVFLKKIVGKTCYTYFISFSTSTSFPVCVDLCKFPVFRHHLLCVPQSIVPCGASLWRILRFESSLEGGSAVESDNEYGGESSQLAGAMYQILSASPMPMLSVAWFQIVPVCSVKTLNYQPSVVSSLYSDAPCSRKLALALKGSTTKWSGAICSMSLYLSC